MANNNLHFCVNTIRCALSSIKFFIRKSLLNTVTKLMLIQAAYCLAVRIQKQKRSVSHQIGFHELKPIHPSSRLHNLSNPVITVVITLAAAAVHFSTSIFHPRHRGCPLSAMSSSSNSGGLSPQPSTLLPTPPPQASVASAYR